MCPGLVLHPDLSWWAALLDTHPSQAGGAHQGHLLIISAAGLAELPWGEGGVLVQQTYTIMVIIFHMGVCLVECSFDTISLMLIV